MNDSEWPSEIGDRLSQSGGVTNLGGFDLFGWSGRKREEQEGSNGRNPDTFDPYENFDPYQSITRLPACESVDLSIRMSTTYNGGAGQAVMIPDPYEVYGKPLRRHSRLREHLYNPVLLQFLSQRPHSSQRALGHRYQGDQYPSPHPWTYPKHQMMLHLMDHQNHQRQLRETLLLRQWRRPKFQQFQLLSHLNSHWKHHHCHHR